LEVVAQVLLNFYSGSSMCPATVWIISGLRSRRKNFTAPIPELFFSWTFAPALEFLVFMSVAPEVSFFMAQAQFRPLFSHVNILIVMVCIKLNEKWIKSSAQNYEHIPNFLSNLIKCFLTSSALTMRKSARKRQSQVQTIQRTVTVPLQTQLKVTVILYKKISAKAVAGFAVNAWGPFVISYDQNQENSCLENYICVRAFKHRPVPIDQVFYTRFMPCLLQSWRFQPTALPGQTMKRAQNT